MSDTGVFIGCRVGNGVSCSIYVRPLAPDWERRRALTEAGGAVAYWDEHGRPERAVWFSVGEDEPRAIARYEIKETRCALP